MTDSILSEPAVFVLADRALNAVVAQIRDDQWAMAMPADFARRGTDTVPTLAEIIANHASDDAWVPDMLAGRTMAEVGSVFDGDLLGAEPKVAFAAIVEIACAAARDCTDLERTVHCSFGDFTAREYFWQVNMFRGLRTHDIARVIGVDAALPADLVRGLWEEISPVADEWRTYGVLPPAREIADDASLLDRLLALTGRPAV